MKPVEVDVPDIAARLVDSAGEIRVNITPSLVPDDPDALAFAQPGGRRTLEVDVRDDRATLAASSGVLGLFTAEPTQAGSTAIWVEIFDPEINDRAIAHSFMVPLGSIDVANPPVIDRPHGWYGVAIGLISSILTIAGFLGLLRRLRPRRGNSGSGERPGSLDRRKATGGPRDTQAA